MQYLKLVIVTLALLSRVLIIAENVIEQRRKQQKWRRYDAKKEQPHKKEKTYRRRNDTSRS